MFTKNPDVKFPFCEQCGKKVLITKITGIRGCVTCRKFLCAGCKPDSGCGQCDHCHDLAISFLNELQNIDYEVVYG